MIQYILECIAFQFVFLIIYDFLLKRETFFQWNRGYLIGTYILSLVLPWIKIESFKTTVSFEYDFSKFMSNTEAIPLEVSPSEDTLISISWQQGVIVLGMVMAAALFTYKMWQLYQLRKKGKVSHFQDFTKVIISNSNLAFSFFRFIFLGDKIIEDVRENIIQHEMVHIKQRHSLDLLFFELLRIVMWFDPLVYVYQNRISELHEFIADDHMAKTHKKEQYQLLLSQVFHTQNISFINRFFKSSLIKKRIVMLQKSKSKRIFQLKYLLLAPIITVMLFYSSCQNESDTNMGNDISKGKSSLSEKIAKLKSEIEARGTLSKEEKEQLVMLIYKTYPKDVQGISGEDGKIEYGGVPFAIVDEVPIFPGCENSDDIIECFGDNIIAHIKKHFNYPKKAQELGIQGRVNVLFTIGSDGMIVNIRTKGPDKLLEEEARRIIDELPRMTPGRHKGQEVHVPYSIPISFRLK